MVSWQEIESDLAKFTNPQCLRTYLHMWTHDWFESDTRDWGILNTRATVTCLSGPNNPSFVFLHLHLGLPDNYYVQEWNEEFRVLDIGWNFWQFFQQGITENNQRATQFHLEFCATSFSTEDVPIIEQLCIKSVSDIVNNISSAWIDKWFLEFFALCHFLVKFH